MTSAVTICSNALLQVGGAPINSLADAGDHATMCANLWPMVRDALLRAHPWPSCRVQTILAPEVAEPSFDWSYSFLLPADWMRTLQVGTRGERLDFEHIGRRLYANTDTLRLVYVRKVTDPVQWDAYMVDAACAEMAARLAYPVAQSASLAQLKRQEAAAVFKAAKSAAGQDNEPEDWGDSPFVDVRG